MKLFIVDPHTIYRQGLAACLEQIPEVTFVNHVDNLDEARANPSFINSEVILLDSILPGSTEFVAEIKAQTEARILICTAEYGDDAVMEALAAGADGFLDKKMLTTDGLATAVRAALNGAGIITPQLLEKLVKSSSAAGTDTAETLSRLTERELNVLSLIAEGLATREVAQRLSYSERTVKNILHDVATKLNARTRSQAVAHAVREGLI